MEIKEIRILTPEEREEYAKIDMISFARTPLERSDDNADDCWGVFADDSGKLCAGLTACTYTMEFGAGRAEVYGLGNVATLPEYRGKGVMAALLKTCLETLREKGGVFSALYPISFDYYRRFGYEMVCRNIYAEIPMEVLAQLPKPTGTVRQFGGYEDGDFSALAEVYDKFKAGKQFAVTRDERLWKKLAGHEPTLLSVYTYVLYDSDDKPCAYFVAHKIGEQLSVSETLLRSVNGCQPKDIESPALIIRELAYTDKNALWEMFAFMRSFRTKFPKIHMQVPFAEFLLAELPAADKIVQQDNSPFSLMLRIVNLPAAFETLSAPTGSGEVIIDVTDEFLPQNAGRYELAWENGKLTAARSAPDKTLPDLQADITVLTQLIAGYLSPGQAMYKSGVKVNGKLDLLQELFPVRQAYIYEKF